MPIANADTAGVSEGIATTDSSSVAGDLTPASASGGDVLDTDQDGDGISVQGVAAGNVGGVQTGNLASDVNGTYGKINVAADGSYTYTLDNTNSSVQSLALGETRNDVFTYTINDSRGGTSTSTVTVTVTGTNDAPITWRLTSSAQLQKAARSRIADRSPSPMSIPQTARPPVNLRCRCPLSRRMEQHPWS